MATVVENRIFINQIPQTATKEDLSAHFSQFGLATDVYMPLIFGSSQHKGMGFVTYENPESVQVALAQPGHYIHGAQVLVELCIAKDKGAGKGAVVGGKPLPGFENTGDRLFVTKIPPEATREEVEAFFSQFGSWTDLYLPNGSFPAGHKGICFISYESPSSVQLALQAAPQAILRGQQLVLDVAAPRDPSKGGGKGVAPAPPPPTTSPGFIQAWPTPQPHAWVAPQLVTGLPSMPVMTGIQPTMAAYPQHVQPAYAAAPLPVVQTSVASIPSVAPGTGHQVPGRLFLTKVAQDVTKEDLTAYFQQFGELTDVFVPSGGKFIAFVSFAEASVAQVVLQNSQHEVKTGRLVNVDPAFDRPPLEAKGKGKFSRFQPY
mmetsp:Transcript_145913/g.269087  ORF Transcript_145913/g.269087 Transcript_145913/m.269087 type:complete len:375 (-) Transcript_145913:13-1137(-)